MTATDDRTMETKAGGSRSSAPQTGIDWLPPVDIVEAPDLFKVALDLCGILREAIDVRLERDRLTVSGVRGPADENEVCHYRERQVGRFARAFTFRVPVDADGIEARLTDGILLLSIPKRLPKKVELE